jgi:hypothetical protein
LAKGEVTEQTDVRLFSTVLGQAVSALEEDGVPYVVFGSVAAIAYGRPNASGDVDVMVRPHEADRALDALERTGFLTEKTDPSWIYKAFREGVLVDVIFKVKGGLYLDEEILAHTRVREYGSQPVRLVSPEDQLLIEAISDDDQSPQHWWNALSILAASDIDWAYLERRARYGARRVLSLLLYAQSCDYVVPDGVVRSLFEAVYGT